MHTYYCKKGLGELGNERKRERSYLLHHAVLTIACRRLLLEGGLDDLGLQGEIKLKKLMVILKIKYLQFIE